MTLLIELEIILIKIVKRLGHLMVRGYRMFYYFILFYITFYTEIYKYFSCHPSLYVFMYGPCMLS